jgi:lysophospholipase L1-like esterase
LKGRKRIAVKLSVVTVSIIFALLIAEVALRIVGYTYPVFYTTDETRGYALRPNMRGWYRKEGESYVEINSAGLRDREHARAKPPNTLRVAVLGDSYAEALQVPFEDAFWKVLERKLNECENFRGQQVEVINFGVSGYGTAQELITLREHVWDYSPDIVLLAFTTNNDITDNSRALKKTDEAPYFVLRDGKLVLDDSFRETRAFRLRQSALNRFGRWVRDSSRVIQALHQAHYAFKQFLSSRRAKTEASPVTTTKESQPTQEEQTQTPAPTSEELGLDNVVYREPSDMVWTEAWRVTEELLKVIRDEVRSRGAKFLVVTTSAGIQVHPEPSAREAFMRRIGVNDLFYPERRIKAFGEREQILVLNLAPPLQSYADEHKVFLHGFDKNIGNGHWNSLGHRVAGEMLAQKLCEGALN